VRYRVVRVAEREIVEGLVGEVEIPGEMPRVAFRVNVGNTPPHEVDYLIRTVRETMREAGITEQVLILPHRGDGTGTEVFEILPVEE